MRLRPILALFLASILSLTSVTVGAARGQSDPADAIVICSSHGIVTIYVDANGEPVPAPHICPDCVLLVAAMPVSHGEARCDLHPTRITPVSPLPFRSAVVATSAQARAPPVAGLQCTT